MQIDHRPLNDPKTLALARAIMEALGAVDCHAFIQGEPGKDETTIDGHFDLLAVARQLEGAFK